MKKIAYYLIFVFAILLLIWDYLGSGREMRFLYGFFLTPGIIQMAWIDIRELQIPPRIQLYCLGMGLWRMVWDFSRIQWYVLGFLAMGGLMLAIAVITKGKMGGGDIKLMALSGLCLGLRDVFLALAIASIVGSFIGVILILSKKIKKEEALPFGPFLGIGIFLAYLYGQGIWDWYWHFG